MSNDIITIANDFIYKQKSKRCEQKLKYELYSYSYMNDEDYYDLEFTTNSLKKIEKYIKRFPENMWLYIDNTGDTYAKFGFSEKELKSLILPCKKKKYFSKIHIKNGDIKRFIRDFDRAQQKAEKESDKLCARVVRKKKMIKRKK